MGNVGGEAHLEGHIAYCEVEAEEILAAPADRSAPHRLEEGIGRHQQMRERERGGGGKRREREREWASRGGACRTEEE